MDRETLQDLIGSEPLEDPRIADAFARVDRADFVPADLVAEAYLDRPVQIPEGQTTSQPSLIARMIDCAAPTPAGRVLEIGTGYGYQTAILARLSAEVVSVERHQMLADAARENLRQAGIDNATVVVGDGWLGWPEAAPYEAIIVSAAADGVPDPLAEQLVEGGRLVIPVKGWGSDDVFLFVREGGRLRQVRLVTPARFVPLVHRPGQATHREEGR